MRSEMQEWKEIRQAVLVNGLSKRAACAKYQLGWHTLAKILAHVEPPGYRKTEARPKRVLAPVLPIIHEILETDKKAPKKQRHTAKRIFERLKEEHGYQGGKTVVEDAVRAWRQRHQAVFLPLVHPAGEAQVDFGEATIRHAGVERKVALFVMTLPYSGAIFGGLPPSAFILPIRSAASVASSRMHRDIHGGTSPRVRVLRRSAETHQL